MSGSYPPGLVGTRRPAVLWPATMVATRSPGTGRNAVVVRTIEQSVFLAALQECLTAVYTNEQTRALLRFDTAHGIHNGTPCVIYDRDLNLWIRAVVVECGEDGVRVAPVDYPIDECKIVTVDEMLALKRDFLLPPQALVVRNAVVDDVGDAVDEFCGVPAVERLSPRMKSSSSRLPASGQLTRDTPLLLRFHSNSSCDSSPSASIVHLGMLAFVPMPTAIADVFVIGEDGIGSLEECLRRNESSQIVTHRAAAAVTGEGKAVPAALSTSVGEGDHGDALDHLSQVGSSGVLMQFVAVCQNRPQSSADESIANGDCVVTRENFVTPAANRCNYDRIELEYLSQGSYGSSTASSSSNAMEGASGSHRDPAHMRVWDDTPTRGAQLRASGRQATTTARASSSGLFADL